MIGPKNRYFSFVHDENPGKQTAVRVTFSDPPAEYEASLKDKVLWVGEPGTITESAGTDASVPPPTFRAAAPVCQPWYTDWGAEGLVHVYSDAIGGAAARRRQAIGLCRVRKIHPLARWSKKATSGTDSQ